MNKDLSKNRIINSFAARNLSVSDDKNLQESIGEYSMRGVYGLELRRRRFKRKKKIII